MRPIIAGFALAVFCACSQTHAPDAGGAKKHKLIAKVADAGRPRALDRDAGDDASATATCQSRCAAMDAAASPGTAGSGSGHAGAGGTSNPNGGGDATITDGRDSVCSPTCSGSARCLNGTCTCANVGEVPCNQQCILTVADEHNCGACGHTCVSGQTCCASKCVDEMSDKAHCGGCGIACGVRGDTCRNAACSCGGASACTSPAQCVMSLFGGAGSGATMVCQ